MSKNMTELIVVVFLDILGFCLRKRIRKPYKIGVGEVF